MFAIQINNRLCFKLESIKTNILNCVIKIDKAQVELFFLFDIYNDNRCCIEIIYAMHQQYFGHQIPKTDTDDYILNCWCLMECVPMKLIEPRWIKVL